VEQHRLRCNIDSGHEASTSFDTQAFSSAPDVNKQMADLTRQVLIIRNFNYFKKQKSLTET
jgi:hypothetical protein